MFGLETFFSMLFVKCKSRGEQYCVVIGMLIMIAGCYGVGKFLLGMGKAGIETQIQMGGSGLGRGYTSDGGEIGLYGYAGAGICALLGIIFAIMAIINTVRLLTGTGLADPNEAW